jgi:outer membrane murein-binding lipoprotein Lpp
MGRMPLICVVLSLGLLAPASSRGDVADRVAELTAQVAKLTAEIETLKAENAALKQKLAETAPSFALGETAKLGAYQYRTPEGWTYQGVKNNTLGALYRSPDKAGVILVVVRPKGAAPMEVQAKYGQNIVQKLKEDFLKAKTEVVEPPAVIPDPRFYLKVHERIKVKEKVADQSHIYLMPGKDMIELSVITTAEASDQVAATQKLAEDVLMSFGPAGK